MVTEDLCVQEVAFSQSRECSTVWVCLQPVKCEIRQRLSLGKQRQLKREWIEGCTEHRFGSLWQGEVSCWGPQEAELQAEQPEPPLTFAAEDTISAVWECWSTKYWWFNAHLVLSGLPLSQKSHIWELEPRNGIRPELLSSWWWYLWGSTTTTKNYCAFYQFSKELH